MDPKASAKSKRTHSTHGRRNHPTAAAAAARKKQQPAAGGDGLPSRRTETPALPSNWDRYESGDEEEEEAMNPATGAQADVVAPKSKGANFGYLIEHARSEPPQPCGPGPESSLFGEFVPGFMQGVSSMSSVRGENLLSLCRDDNFIVDEGPTSGFEVPFLSMDLHALAAQLSKLKLSRRLFIEADLLPEEMNDDQLHKSTISEEQSETLEKSELRDTPDPPLLIGKKGSGKNEHVWDNVHPVFISDTGLGKIEDVQGNTGSSTVSVDYEIAKKVADVPFETSAAQPANIIPINDSELLEESSRREVEDIMPVVNTLPKSSEWGKTSTVQAATVAEAELDMLLQSFGQSSLSSSIVVDAPNDGLAWQSAPRTSAPISLTSISQVQGSSRNTTRTYLDDEIDDLLGGTTLGLQDQEHIAHQNKEVSTASLPPSSGPTSASGIPIYTVMAASLDDSIDLLLDETSSVLDRRQTTHSHKEMAVPSIAPHRSVAPQPMDDFDSWLETL